VNLLLISVGGVVAQVDPLFVYNKDNFPESNNLFGQRNPISVDGSSEAVHTRSANCDIDSLLSLIGIVWCDQNGNAEVSLNTFVANTATTEYDKTFHDVQQNYQIDPSYEVGFPDVSVSFFDDTHTAMLVTVVYQRRLAGAAWEIAYKRYIISNYATL